MVLKVNSLTKPIIEDKLIIQKVWKVNTKEAKTNT